MSNQGAELVIIENQATPLTEVEALLA